MYCDKKKREEKLRNRTKEKAMNGGVQKARGGSQIKDKRN
jgi:hypothetical protein